jgi:hypothetical protein
MGGGGGGGRSATLTRLLVGEETLETTDDATEDALPLPRLGLPLPRPRTLLVAEADSQSFC